MVKEMENLPQVGYIKTAESGMGDALMYARSTELPDGGRQVVVATNRPISMAGSLAPGTAQKYDLSVVEMRWKKGDKKGEGKMTLAAEASIKDGKLQHHELHGSAAHPQGHRREDPVALRFRFFSAGLLAGEPGRFASGGTCGPPSA